jgi:pyruvate/2-oxoglutarate dehydrogenase complex dihydrolipoamide dehydrogenase (E3) component
VADEIDVVVVGLGVGGEEVAGRLAEAGLRVVGIEHRLVGGECPYWGCIPSKMMIRAATLLAEARRIDGVAGHAHVEPDWTPVAKRIRDVATDNWDDRVAVDRFVKKGGHFVRGYARLAGPGRVEVDDRTYVATRGIVIGTGTAPVIPPLPGLAGTPYWTNREAIEVEVLPDSLVVLGGGAIGLELAQMFARFGVAVTVVESGERVLSIEEPEASALLDKAFESDGVTVHKGSRATSVEYDGTQFAVVVDDGHRLVGQKLLVATGRRAVLDDLGLSTVDVDSSARFLSTDEWMRVSDGIWAIGDVTGHGAFTHMAMYEADIAVRDILGEGGAPADYRSLPRVTFTDPEIGAVGLTEAQARQQGIDVAVGFNDSSTRDWIHGGNGGFVKLVADEARGVLVGATSAGPAGGEVLSGLTVAVHAEVPLTTLRNMAYAYPTFHRGIEPAVRQLTDHH